MKILIGSYTKGIYSLTINELTGKFQDKKIHADVTKASYLINEEKFAYIYSKDGLGFLHIDGQEILLNESPTHLSYNSTNDSLYTSFYGAGILKVLRKKTSWEVTEVIKFGNAAKIHYASFIPKTNQVGVVDLGNNKIHFYEDDNKLVLKQTITFDDNFGPRHFINHPRLPIIYLISELIPTVHTLQYKNGIWLEIDRIKLEKGAGSAIRISKSGTNLFAAVRFSNLLYHFNVDAKGRLSLNKIYNTLGDHPRDFNLVYNDKYLVIANMYSDNLTLYEITENGLLLKDNNFNLDHGASIIYCK